MFSECVHGVSQVTHLTASRRPVFFAGRMDACSNITCNCGRLPGSTATAKLICRRASRSDTIVQGVAKRQVFANSDILELRQIFASPRQKSIIVCCETCWHSSAGMITVTLS